MLRQKAISAFLVLLVSVLCPIACGLRAAAAGESMPTTDCCGHRLPNHDQPNHPVQPTNPPPDSCFCSTEGVTIDRVDASRLPDLSLAFTSDAQEDQSPNASTVSGTPPRSHRDRPDEQRILPLLI